VRATTLQDRWQYSSTGQQHQNGQQGGKQQRWTLDAAAELSPGFSCISTSAAKTEKRASPLLALLLLFACDAESK